MITVWPECHERSQIITGQGLSGLGSAIGSLASSIFRRKAGGIIGAIADIGISVFSKAGGGGKIPGFATGGGFNILCRHDRDNNTLSLNGLPIAKVSHGERVNVSSDNSDNNGGSSRVTVVPSPLFDVVVDGRVQAGSQPLATGAAIAGAQRAQESIGRRNRRVVP